MREIIDRKGPNNRALFHLRCEANRLTGSIYASAMIPVVTIMIMIVVMLMLMPPAPVGAMLFVVRPVPI